MASRNPRKQKAIQRQGTQGTGLYDALVAATAPVREELLREIRLSDIVRSDDVQVRVGGISKEKVEEYRIRLENESEAPPIDVFALSDGTYLLAAGFHRLEAYKQAGRHTIKATVRQGDLIDAREFAEEDNLDHGLPYTLQDKRNIFMRRAEDGRAWFEMVEGIVQQKVSDRAIARDLGVSAPTIKRWLDELMTVTGITVDDTKTAGKDGRVRDTTRIAQTAPKRFEGRAPNEPAEQNVGDDAYRGTSAEDESYFEASEETYEDPRTPAYYSSNPPAFEPQGSVRTNSTSAERVADTTSGSAEYDPQDVKLAYQRMVVTLKELDRLYGELSRLRGIEHIHSVMGTANVQNLEKDIHQALEIVAALDHLLREQLNQIY